MDIKNVVSSEIVDNIISVAVSVIDRYIFAIGSIEGNDIVSNSSRNYIARAFQIVNGIIASPTNDRTIFSTSGTNFVIVISRIDPSL